MPAHQTEIQSQSSLALVTAAAGFLGQHLVQALKQRHLQLILTDQPLPSDVSRLDYLFLIFDPVIFTPASFSDLLDRLASSLPASFAGKILLCCPLSFSLSLSQLQRLPNYRLIRLDFDQLYGPHMNLSGSSPLSQFFAALHQRQPLTLPGDGLDLIYPTFVADVVTGLTQAMFTAATSGHEFVLVNPQGITLLNLTYLLRQLAPGRQLIDFHPHRRPPLHFSFSDDWLIAQTSLHWHPQTSLEQGIVQTLEWLSTLTPSIPSVYPVAKLYGASPRLHFSFHFSPPLALLALILALVLIWPVFSFGFNFALGSYRLQQSFRSLASADVVLSQTRARQAASALDRSYTTFISLARLWPSATPPLLTRWQNLTFAFWQLASAQLDLTAAAMSAASLGPAFLGQTDTSPQDILNQLQLDLDSAKNSFALASAELAKPRPNLESFRWFNLGSSFISLRSQTNRLHQLASQATTLAHLVRHLLSSSATYLVLLQNNGELRPTGGFIESIGLATIESGRLVNLEFMNTYAVDSQLQGLVEPPLPLKTYLGESGWYLRDSNWDPNFPTSARQAEWFVTKEINRHPQATLALNLFALRRLLEIIGPVQLPSIKSPLTAANLFSSAFNYRQPDLLSQILNQVYQQLPQLSPPAWLKLYLALYQSLADHQLLISPLDSQLNATLDALRWNGSLLTSPALCPDQPCLSDFLIVTEANLGANQANFFVTRNLHHQVKVLRENNLVATTSITYRNTSPSETWPGGTYKNYLRLSLPAGSQLQQVNLDGQPLLGNQISVATTSTATVIGFLVTVPSQAQTTVTITYQLPGSLQFTDNKAYYSLFLPKQSGTNPDPATVTLTLSPYIRLTATTPQREPIPGVVTFLTDLGQDRHFSLSLEK